MIFKRKGDPHRYDFLDAQCLGKECWSPGLYQSRGATLSGSRATSSPPSPCCMHRAYHGCPDKTPFDESLAQARRKEWRRV